MASSSRKIVLKSSDGQTFEMEEAEAHLSLMIKHMTGDDCAEASLPITGDILSKIIDYCRTHVNTADDDQALRSFDSEFMNEGEATLYQMANAARFLDIKNLSNMLWEALADRREKRRSNPELYRRVPASRSSVIFRKIIDRRRIFL